MENAYILQMKDITKRFPGVVANDNVNLAVKQGEVHGILGENGAGKSTLMNVLCGLYRPSSGQILFEGAPVHFTSAKDAQAHGIGMVHQHFMLVPSFTVVENCLIGYREDGVLINTKKAAKRIEELASQYNLCIDPYKKVEDLAVGEQQRVEIIKALLRGAKILILDEPSAVLTPQETEELFGMVRNLVEKKYTVLFISHKLNEVKTICDNVTVMRLGKSISTHAVKDCSVNDLAKLMVGREVNFSVTKGKSRQEEVVLDIQNLSLSRPDPSAPKLLDKICMQVKEGEIVGIAGVDGNGQNELVQCLTGLQKASEGQVLFGGQNILGCTTRQIMAEGVSHIPQDRNKTGLVLSMSLYENMILQDYYKKEFGRGPLVNWSYARAYTAKLVGEFNVKTPNVEELAQNLSGGNQQALIAAREISRSPRLLIAMHPTRGLDVGRIEYIHQLLIRQRDAGMAIILVSTELEEILKLSDRVFTLYEGRFMGEVTAKEATVEKMGLMMGGTPLS